MIRKIVTGTSIAIVLFLLGAYTGDIMYKIGFSDMYGACVYHQCQMYGISDEKCRWDSPYSNVFKFWERL